MEEMKVQEVVVKTEEVVIKTEKENEAKLAPQFVPANYKEICDKLLTDMDKDYEKTIASNQKIEPAPAEESKSSSLSSNNAPPSISANPTITATEEIKAVSAITVEQKPPSSSNGDNESEDGKEGEGYAPLEDNPDDVLLL